MSNNNRNIIKNTLNTYLKQKNYPINERFRRSDLVLTQSKEDFLMDLKIRNEITRTNSFTFSNISSLNGSQSPVDSQVNKLIKFIQCQKNSLVRKELQNLLPPLVCHLFVEMLKGKEWRPAHEFLRKYSSLLGTFQEITPQRINGTDPSTLMPQKIYFLPHSTNSTSQMKFASTSKQPQIAQLNIEEQKLNLFRELVTTLSCIKDLQDTNDNKIISFRSSKYKAHLSRKSHAILKKYLARDAHVLITQVIHSWFSWDLYELHEDSNDSSSPSSPEMLTTTNNNNFDFNSSENNSMVARHQQHRNNVNRFSSECDNQKDIKFNYNNNRLDSPQIEQQTTNYDMNETNEFFGSNLKLKRLHESLNRVNSKYHKPIRIFNINYTENSLCTASVDKSLCHMAAGLEDSTVVLWSLNGYENYGRKPFQSFDDRLCQWSINNCNRVLTDDLSDFGSDEEIEDNLRESLPDDNDTETERLSCSNGINREFQSRTYSRKKSGNKYRTKTSMRKQWSDYSAKSCSENNFSLDSQSIVLRGHRNSVTDVLFGKKESILLTTSRDKTFRLWKADSYTCACVYRGHEFPIWCIDESSNGCYAVTGSKDTTARLWSYERKFPVKIYPGHSQDVDCIAFHPNGNYFATGSADTTIRMWCVTSGKLLRIFTECHLPVNTISFSPDGKLLAAAGDESKIRIFDLATGQQLLDLKNHTASVKSLSWSMNSKKLLSGCSDGSFYVWNINNNLGLSSSTNSSSKDSKSSSMIAGTSRNSAGLSTSIGETSTSSKPSSSNPSTSSNSPPMSSLIQSNSTGCKRIVKVFFHGPGELVHAIGND